MNIGLYSDLHLEFEGFNLDSRSVDIIVLAGDIDVGTRGVDWIVNQKFSCPVIYVLGNHEFYKQTYPSLIGKIKERAAGSNIHVLENESIDIDGINFHGATLWTNFELFGHPVSASRQCQNKVNDFKKIRIEPTYSRLKAIDTAIIHRESLRWLGRSLNASTSLVNIVITHHAPSMKSVPPMYESDIVTAAYASDLSKFIADHKPNYWLHGHLHNSSNYQLGECKVLCNPKGYKGEVNESFDPAFVFTV